MAEDHTPEAQAPSAANLETALAVLRRDLSKLSNNLGVVEHTVKTDCKELTLRLHYPAFRQRKPMVSELIDAVSLHIMNFCLPRTQVNEVLALYEKVGVGEFVERLEVARQEAYDLFKRAHVATNRNGEAGELILYLLTEWLLDAPQIIAKMALKTNSEMPVHGADGVHVRYCPDTSRLLVYWGEAKLYQDVGAAVAEAAKSIAESLTDEKIKHEITLVRRYVDFTGMPDSAKKALLAMLDPFGPGYKSRHDVITCLIAFDFDAFAAIQAGAGDAQAAFAKLALTKLEEVAPKMAQALKNKGMAGQAVELFVIPVPSVARMRELFQNKIGWKPTLASEAAKTAKAPVGKAA